MAAPAGRLRGTSDNGCKGKKFLQGQGRLLDDGKAHADSDAEGLNRFSFTAAGVMRRPRFFWLRVSAFVGRALYRRPVALRLSL